MSGAVTRGIGEFWTPQPERFGKLLWESKPFHKNNKAEDYEVWMVVFWLLKTGRQFTSKSIWQWAGRSNRFVKPIIEQVQAAFAQWARAEGAHSARTPKALKKHTPQRDMAASVDEACTPKALKKHTPSTPPVSTSARATTDNKQQKQQSSSSTKASTSEAAGTTAAPVAEQIPEPAEAPAPAPEPIPMPPAEETDGVMEEETSPEADPRQLKLEVAFAAVGNHTRLAGTALWMLGMRRLGDLAVLQSRGDLCGQLEGLRSGSSSHPKLVPVLEAVATGKGIARIASTAQAVLRYHGLAYEGATSSAQAAPLKPWEEPCRDAPQDVAGDALPFFLASQYLVIEDIWPRIQQAGGGWPELRGWLDARVQQPDLVVEAIRTNHPALGGDPFAATELAA